MPQIPNVVPSTEWMATPVHMDSIFSFDLGEELMVKKLVQKTTDNWLEAHVGYCFNLPKLPRQEPKFIKDFIINNKLEYANPQFQFADPKAHVGIEVEIENISYINPNIPLCFWKITEDGSLRNHGKEFKSVALPIKYAQLALEQLFSGLNPDIDFSSRTSIHFHLDVRGLEITQLITLMFVYATVENLLFKFVGANRRNSIFCTPITETRFFTDLDITKKNRMFDCLQTIWQKYSALNMLPISQFGTVEFRQMAGTSNVTKLCIWLDLLSRIRLFAYKNTLSNVLNTISDLNTNSQYRHFIESVFGELTVYLDTTSLISDMEKPVFICKNCVAINKFHNHVITTINPESSLTQLIGQQLIVKNFLTSELYYRFKLLFSEKFISHAIDLDNYYQIFYSLKEYRRVYKDPSLKPLFDFIETNSVGAS